MAETSIRFICEVEIKGLWHAPTLLTSWEMEYSRDDAAILGWEGIARDAVEGCRSCSGKYPTTLRMAPLTAACISAELTGMPRSVGMRLTAYMGIPVVEDEALA